MEFQFKNFGKAGTGNVEINDLTVICGLNNTGKTYINYAIFSILSNLENLINVTIEAVDVENLITELDSKGSSRIKITDQIAHLSDQFLDMKPITNSNISKYFSLPETNFEEAKISLKLNDFGKKDKMRFTRVKFRNGLRYILTFDQEEKYINVNTDLLTSDDDSENNESILKLFNNDIEQAKAIIESNIKKTIYIIFLGQMIPEPFAITSERTGVSLFYKVFDKKNEAILTYILDEENVDTVSDVSAMHSRLAFPIRDNIDQVRFYDGVSKKDSFIVAKSKEGISKEVLMILNDLLDHGSFYSENDTIMYKPSDTSRNEPTIPLYAASSSIKSLFMFDLFIKHVAESTSMLIIDEPELNLHPKNQIKMAKLVARLVNSGVKVLITTHSDFLIRELNDLITMDKVPESERKKLDESILDSDILCKSQVSAYEITPEGKCESLEVNHTGINSKLLEDTIGFASRKSIRVFEAAELPDEE